MFKLLQVEIYEANTYMKNKNRESIRDATAELQVNKKFTSGRGWGMTLRDLSYKAFNWPSHPDHKYIWIRGGDLNH